MSLFSQRWIREHFIPRDPGIDTSIREPAHPLNGDVLVYSTDYGRGVYATPPVAQNIGGTAVDGDHIEWDAVTDVFVLQGPVLGTIYVSAGVTAQATTDAAAKMTGFAANGPEFNTDADHTDDSITVLQDGTFLVTFTAEYAHATAAAGVFFSVRVGGTGTYLQCTGPQNGNVALSGHLNLADNSVVTVYVSNGVGEDGNFTPVNAQLTVTRVGPYVAP